MVVSHVARHFINRLCENDVIIHPYSTLGEQDAVSEQIRLERGRFEYVERLGVFSAVSRDVLSSLFDVVLFNTPIRIRTARYTQRKRVFSERQRVCEPRQLVSETALLRWKRRRRETIPVFSHARECVLSNLERYEQYREERAVSSNR